MCTRKTFYYVLFVLIQVLMFLSLCKILGFNRNYEWAKHCDNIFQRYDFKSVDDLTKPCSNTAKAILTNIENNTVWGCNTKYEWAEHFESIFRRYNSKPVEDLTKHSSNTAEALITNIEKVLSYPFHVDKKYLKHLSLDAESFQKLQRTRPNFSAQLPVFVTAADAKYFHISQALLKNLDLKIRCLTTNKMILIYYDIGLNPKQRKQIEKYCQQLNRCDLRTFNFGRYPEHVRILKGYAFKPIIIQEVISEHDFVFWLDASIRLTGNMTELIQNTKERGIQVLPNGGSISKRTGRPTFDFLKEHPTDFLPYTEISAGATIVIRNNFTLTAILRPWTLCALSYGCMVYPNSERDLKSPCGGKKPMHNCHRFDQSVLGIILSRLFADRRYLFGMDFKPKLETVIDVRRSHSAEYFCEILTHC